MRRQMVTTLLVLTGFSPTLAWAYGEGEDIPYEARAIHLLTNEARSDVPAALAKCGSNCSEGISCYKASYPAAYWRDDFYRASQFHANMLSYINCIQHDSPCTLVSAAASNFPAICDGKPACACQGGTAKCGTSGTKTFDRIRMFASGATAENIASNMATPWGSFHLWLLENGKGDGCTFTVNNGHRFSILSDRPGIGVGAKSWVVMVLGSAPAQRPALTAGSHYVNGDKVLWFKTHYQANVAARSAVVQIGTACHDLAKTRGSNTLGVWGFSPSGTLSACTPYFFEITDVNGTVTRYPTTGSLLYSCDRSWSSQAAKSCAATDPGDGGDPGTDPGDGGDPGTDPGDGGDPGTDPGDGGDPGDDGSGSGGCQAGRLSQPPAAALGIWGGLCLLIGLMMRRRTRRS